MCKACLLAFADSPGCCAYAAMAGGDSGMMGGGGVAVGLGLGVWGGGGAGGWGCRPGCVCEVRVKCV